VGGYLVGGGVGKVADWLAGCLVVFCLGCFVVLLQWLGSGIEWSVRRKGILGGW
jgi:hypothetical protein